MIPVRLTNRWVQFRCPPETQLLLKPHFAYRVPGCEFSEKYIIGAWDGTRCMMQRGRVATGLFLEMQAELEKEFEFKIEDGRIPLTFLPAENFAEDRPYQQEAEAAMVMASSTGGIVLAATASGKTFLVGRYFRRLQGMGCFVVSELTLLEQARKELQSIIGREIGVVGKSEFKPRRYTVATIQTLHKHRDKRDFRAWFSKLDVLIIDELHLMLNRRNLDVVQQIQPKAVFGLTATLELEKHHIRLPATALTGPIIFRYPLATGVQEGYLSRGIVIRLQFNDPLRGRAPGYQSSKYDKELKQKVPIWIPSGSSDADYRYRIVLNKRRNDCIEALTREGVRRQRRVIVLVERLPHLNTLSQRTVDIEHRVLCGEYSQAERVAAQAAMDAGELPLIYANRVFYTGVNIRTLDTIIDATALPGRNSAQQRYGRGARTAEGKTGLIYIDITDAGNQWAGTAAARKRALRELGVPIVNVRWEGSAEAVYKRAEAELAKLTEAA